jgi:hypothetical protein
LDDLSSGAFAGALAAAIVAAQLACLFIVGRCVILRSAWRARLRWATISLLVYVAVLATASRLAVAAIVTTLIVRSLIALWDQRVARRAAAVPPSADRRASTRHFAAWFRSPILDATAVGLMLALAILLVWEPHDVGAITRLMAFMAPAVDGISPWWLFCAVPLLVLVYLLVMTEPSIRDFCYAASLMTLVFCGLLLVTSRPGFAALCVFLMMGGLAYLSVLRFDRTGANLHAYDFIYVLPNFPAVIFWIRNESRTALSFLIVIMIGAILLCVVFLEEPAAIGRRVAFLLVVIAAAAFAVTRRFLVPWTYAEQFGRRVHFARLTESVFEAFHAYRGGGVLRAEAASGLPKFASGAVPDGPGATRPTIIHIMNESTFPPAVYRPELNDPDFADFFQSFDGRPHGLRVEIFGGASWITDFSALTGIPGSCYGAFATHVFHWAADRIHHSTPQYLKAHGYRTGMIYPLVKEFLGADRFYRSIGFDAIVDRTAFGPNSGDREPDSFYLNRALDWLDDHFAETQAPAFLSVMTMSNHYPHDVELVEEGGELRATTLSDSEFDEYLRRLRRTCRDYADFRKALARRFPGREFLIVHLGDHQPPFTAALRGQAAWQGTPQDLFVGGDALSRTYFAIQGVNFKPPIASLPDIIEPAYLSTLTLAAAGIALDGLHQFRYELMQRHDGRLFFADEQGKIAAQLNRRMIELGHVTEH